jgi:hypothetical protein
MDDRTRVAYHEAAHAVLAYRLGGHVLEPGIDIDAPSSVTGAYGRAGVTVFAHDDRLDEREQQTAVKHSVAIMCAGAASDAKILGRNLPDALAHQPGDEKAARELLKSSPSVTSPEEIEVVLQGGLKYAARLLERSEIWKAIDAVAQACLKAGGNLSKVEIDRLLDAEFIETRTAEASKS